MTASCGYVRWFVLGTLAPLMAVACTTYTIETALRADGSGVRGERVEVEENDDVDVTVSPASYRKLMHMTEQEGWRYRVEEKGGDEIHVFTREARVRDLATWDQVSGRVRISAAVEGSGDPRYSDVAFRNAVQVERGEGSEGRTYTYRETFYWENLIGALVDFQVEAFRRSVAARYPRLEPETRGELVGLVKGAAYAAVEDGLWELGESDKTREFTPLVENLTQEAIKLVGARSGGSDQAFFRDALLDLFVWDSEDEDEQAEVFLSEKLPGTALAGYTEIVFRLTMPGRVVDSNAHDRDGSRLEWKFSPWDAVPVPVEVYAKARLVR